MPTPAERLAQVKRELAAHPPVQRRVGAHPLLAAARIAPKVYKLVAEGDSWFDYLPAGNDIVHYLKNEFGHTVNRLAKHGSLLNDMCYPLLNVDPNGKSRLATTIEAIQNMQPDALIFSGGGNDIAGPEFFSFVNNAQSGLPNPDPKVIDGVVNDTLNTGYRDMIDVLLAHTPDLKIFVHGYAYPWPDGRGVGWFNIFGGPWFDDSFNQKGYPRDTDPQLVERRRILAGFVDAFNAMLAGLEASYPGNVHYVDFRNLLVHHADWANELHPNNDGFEALSALLNLKLHQVLG